MNERRLLLIILSLLLLSLPLLLSLVIILSSFFPFNVIVFPVPVSSRILKIKNISDLDATRTDINDTDKTLKPFSTQGFCKEFHK